MAIRPLSWWPTTVGLFTLVAAVLSSGCFTVSQSLEADLRATDEVQVAVQRRRGTPLVLRGADDIVPLARTRDDIIVGKGQGYSALSEKGARTVVTAAPSGGSKELPTEGGALVWRRELPVGDGGIGVSERELTAADIAIRDGHIELLASTPTENVSDARVVTWWRHRYGLVLPTLAGIGGGLLVTAATIGLVNIATGPPEEQRVEGSVALGTIGVIGAGLLAYCVTSWVLDAGSPWIDPVEVPQAQRKARRRASQKR